MSADKAAEAQAYVRGLLTQRDPALALTLESALNDELIKRCQALNSLLMLESALSDELMERCQALSAFVREVAEAGGMAPLDMAERARKLLEEV